MNTDGSNKKTIVTDCRNCDGIVVDVEAGHIYWTNIENTVPKSELLKPFITKSANGVIHERNIGRDPAC